MVLALLATPPADVAPPERLRAVPCDHCGHTIAEIGYRVLVIRHGGCYHRITDLTPSQEIWAKCPRCHRTQRIIVPG